MLPILLLLAVGVGIALWRRRSGNRAVLVLLIGASGVVIADAVRGSRVRDLAAAVVVVIGTAAAAGRRRFRRQDASPDGRAPARARERLVGRLAGLQAGADGRLSVADRLVALQSEGWLVVEDLELPVSRTDVDALVISPTGVVIMPDSRRLSGRGEVRISGGRVFHGQRDVTDRLNGVYFQAAQAARLLGVPVIPVIVADGPSVEGGELWQDGLLVVAADRMGPMFRQLGRPAGDRPQSDLAARTAQLLHLDLRSKPSWSSRRR